MTKDEEIAELKRQLIDNEEAVSYWDDKWTDQANDQINHYNIVSAEIRARIKSLMGMAKGDKNDKCS